MKPPLAARSTGEGQVQEAGGVVTDSLEAMHRAAGIMTTEPAATVEVFQASVSSIVPSIDVEHHFAVGMVMVGRPFFRISGER
jgi:hypothetical protein